MVIGDGEEALIAILEAVAVRKAEGFSRQELLLRLRAIPGVYIPEFFAVGPDGGPRPLVPGYDCVQKAIVPDLDTAPFPTCQVVPFAQAVHGTSRWRNELARVITRLARWGKPFSLKFAFVDQMPCQEIRYYE